MLRTSKAVSRSALRNRNEPSAVAIVLRCADACWSCSPARLQYCIISRQVCTARALSAHFVATYILTKPFRVVRAYWKMCRLRSWSAWLGRLRRQRQPKDKSNSSRTHVSAIFPSSAYACWTILDTASPSGTWPANVLGRASSSSFSSASSLGTGAPRGTTAAAPFTPTDPLTTFPPLTWTGLAALLLVLSRWMRIFSGWDGVERCSGSCITIRRCVARSRV